MVISFSGWLPESMWYGTSRCVPTEISPYIATGMVSWPVFFLGWKFMLRLGGKLRLWNVQERKSTIKSWISYKQCKPSVEALFYAHQKVWFLRKKTKWHVDTIARIDRPILFVEFKVNLFQTLENRILTYFGDNSLPPETKTNDTYDNSVFENPPKYDCFADYERNFRGSTGSMEDQTRFNHGHRWRSYQDFLAKERGPIDSHELQCIENMFSEYEDLLKFVFLTTATTYT